MDKPTSIDNDLHPEPARSRRKFSATVAALERQQHDRVDFVDAAEILDEADRRLAEMGYVAVRLDFANANSHPANVRFQHRSTSASSHGCHAFPSLSRYRVSLPASPPPTSIHSLLVAPLVPFGAG